MSKAFREQRVGYTVPVRVDWAKYVFRLVCSYLAIVPDQGEAAPQHGGAKKSEMIRQKFSGCKFPTFDPPGPELTPRRLGQQDHEV